MHAYWHLRKGTVIHTANSTHAIRCLRSDPSTSNYYERISAEQAAIEAQLLELVDVEAMNAKLQNTTIKGETDMIVDMPEGPSPPAHSLRTLSAKQRALALYVRHPPIVPHIQTLNLVLQSAREDLPDVGTFSFQEAVEIEQRAHAADRARQERINDKKKRMGLPIKGEVLTREEKDARMYAFL
jgi:hypothetical protein